ncbi:MAG TPA: hypothetical protein VEY30_13695 [Myxococcaceae bacterium]|nr:hypothetical protein [Myxococcaceae bacterium]
MPSLWTPQNAFPLLAALAASALILRFNFWRAVLCLAPKTFRSEWDAPADQVRVPTELEPLARDLADAGFRLLGSRVERPRFARPWEQYEFVHPEHPVFATVSRGPGGDPWLYFLTPVGRHDGFVLTANHRRVAKEEPGRYLSAGLEEASAPRLFRAHLRRISAFAVRGEFTAEGRAEAAQQWLDMFGRSELRRQHTQGLVWSLSTLGLVAAALFGRR